MSSRYLSGTVTHSPSWVFGTTVFQFYASSTSVPIILQELERIECGVSFGLVSVLPVSMVKPKLDEEIGINIQSRLPIEEVYDRVSKWQHWASTSGCTSSWPLQS